MGNIDFKINEFGEIERGTNDSEILTLAHKYSSQKNYTEAFKLYQQAAQQGNAAAQNYLGNMYDNGYGITQNYTEAFNWYLKAAQQGDASAECEIGHRYYRGYGIAKNYTEAFNWYYKSAQQGYNWGQRNLGLMYHYGQGVAKNYEKAFEWYLKAAKQGGTDAETMLKQLKATKQGGTKILKNKGGCFVATACYGNYDAPEVLILRAYRDEVLLKSILGTAFVKFYYFVSPPLAKQIEKSGKAKKFIRKYLLSPIIRKINIKSKVRSGRETKKLWEI
jgi:hypothetical protein